ncbi:hypothetical protein DOK_05670 [gamma proteobacterium BDW918]|nr:hypothetical protein DOK_05670 [gamma proteobacterium BDW918]
MHVILNATSGGGVVLGANNNIVAWHYAEIQFGVLVYVVKPLYSVWLACCVLFYFKCYNSRQIEVEMMAN